MTLGNVKILQVEQERDADGNLVTFRQAKPAYPAVGPVEFDSEPMDINGSEVNLYHADLKNVVDKFVTVNNTGKSDAYVRTVIAIEAPDGAHEDLIHFNYNQNEDEVVMGEGFVDQIDGHDFYIIEFLYKDELAAGAKSAPSLLQLFLDSMTDNDDCAKFGESWEVLAVSQAVQTNGFDDPKTALDTAFGEIKQGVYHPWIETVIVDADDENKLKTTLASGKDVILNTDIVSITDAAFDGKNQNITLAGVGAGSYGYLSFNPGASKDAEVKDLTVTGSGFVEVGHYGQKGGNYTVDNLTVKGVNATLTAVNGKDKLAAAFAHYGTATLNNCEMTGATTTVEGFTAYDAGFINGTKTVINGGEYGSMYVFSQAHVTLNNVKVGDIVSSAIDVKNLGMLTIGAGTEVNSITITCADKYTPGLKIEEGAKVGTIIYKGDSYTQAEWAAL